MHKDAKYEQCSDTQSLKIQIGFLVREETKLNYLKLTKTILSKLESDNFL